MNYYNENDPKAAAWLRELMKVGLIPNGEIDERSIADVQPGGLFRFTQCHFFAGIGGWSHALALAGWPADRPVWTGSCPCQPFSAAGKQRGTADERHLWPEFFRLIRECRPSTIFGEQVASKLGREWLAGVFADLESVGYAVAGADLCAASVAAPHRRQRLFWVADAEHDGRRTDEPRRGPEEREVDGRVSGLDDILPCLDGKQRRTPKFKSGICLLADGFWYRLAHVLPEITQEAMKEIELYAKKSGTDADQILPLVQANLSQETLWGPFGRQNRIYESEVLLTFMRDISSALNRGAEHCRKQEEGSEDNRRMLRDLRIALKAERASCGRKPDEQQAGEPSDSLSALSQFLARCCESSWSISRREDASTFPLSGKVNGRVGLLRGYGNAIVPQVAAQFIKAFLES